MDEQKALINLGELSKPATVLIKKITAGIGGLLAPWQAVRVARGEVAAAKVRLEGQIELSEIQERALRNALDREVWEQENITAIVMKALPELGEEADPSRLDDDWIAQFFHLFRRTSHEEMQGLWGRLLATEANRPGSFSKRTLNIVSMLERSDAEVFGLLCGLCIEYRGEIFPLVYDFSGRFYEERSLDENCFNNLEDLGLLTVSMEKAIRTHGQDGVEVSYFGQVINVATNGEHSLSTGRVALTRAGEELFRVSGAVPVDGFVDYFVPRLSPRKKGSGSQKLAIR